MTDFYQTGTPSLDEYLGRWSRSSNAKYEMFVESSVAMWAKWERTSAPDHTHVIYFEYQNANQLSIQIHS